MTDERWPEELVERLSKAWCEAVSPAPTYEPYVGVRAVLNTLASDPEAKRAIMGTPAVWMVEVLDKDGVPGAE